MEIKFIAQGLDSDINTPLGSELIRCFNNENISDFTCLVAFVSKAAVLGLSDCINTNADRLDSIKFIVGIDQNGTSYEALEEISKLDAESWVYYTRQRIIYHPKIYIFEGEENYIFIGSSNLTTPGLFQNIEASVRISYNEGDEEGIKILTDIKTYFKDLIGGNDLNTQKITTELIELLLKQSIVLKEKDRIARDNKERSDINENRDDNDLSELKTLFPSIKLQKPSSDFKYKRKKEPLKKGDESVIEEVIITSDETVIDGQVEEQSVVRGDLVWQKSNLPQSDVLYTDNPLTNPTGGLRLTQARFQSGGQVIDQTTYFRNDLFDNYNWIAVRQNPYVEDAIIPFSIKIFGKDFGVHHLTVKHKPSGVAGQGNYTTSISWGRISKVIRRYDLRTKTLNLHQSTYNGAEIFEISFT